MTRTLLMLSMAIAAYSPYLDTSQETKVNKQKTAQQLVQANGVTVLVNVHAQQTLAVYLLSKADYEAYKHALDKAICYKLKPRSFLILPLIDDARVLFICDYEKGDIMRGRYYQSFVDSHYYTSMADESFRNIMILQGFSESDGQKYIEAAGESNRQITYKQEYSLGCYTKSVMTSDQISRLCVKLSEPCLFEYGPAQGTPASVDDIIGIVESYYKRQAQRASTVCCML